MVSLRSQLLLFLLGQSAELASALPPSPAGHRRQAQSHDLPLTWNPFGFLSNASVGTPAQQFPVFVDWTWINQYVLSTTCYGQTGNPSACLDPTQHYFNQSASSTFQALPQQYPRRTWNPNHFYFYRDLTVDHGTDFLHVGPSTAKIVLQTADITFNLSGSPFPFGGVYGLSPVFHSDNASTSSGFYQAWKQGQWPSPHVAFHYCYADSPDTTKSTCNGHDGIQTLGGINRKLVKNDKIYWYPNKVFLDVNTKDFVYAPALYNYWATDLDSFRIGNETMTVKATAQNPKPAAIFDHASYGRGTALTPNAYNHLIQLAGATPTTLQNPPNNGNQTWHEFDCAKASTLPTIYYKFAGHSKEWPVEAHHYVEKVEDKCVLNVRTLADGDEFIGNFGETFSKDKYIIFDFEKLQLGIAELDWNAASRY
ncbi:eukaryotic aspartyl protease [Hypoxylon trugodes]|uniref:eukaryotic aspartyl protease n=1 Tax=Hypoxylon trugodes TaxID=326681 RepID=UPI0021A0EB33|nr:eukaryotic aspartyl protease [Hypoxylon trugodes]KAI1391903.1 eukaryotic aspartyl protease [Hypoxylon trugodes]